MSEELKVQKFRQLGITEKEFKKLPVEDRLSRLDDLKDVKTTEWSTAIDERDITARRKHEIEELLSNAITRHSKATRRTERLEELWGRYRLAVHEQRVVIGSIGAYTYWYNRAEAKLDVAKMRHYSIKIAVNKERLLPLKEKARELREKMDGLPRLRTRLRKTYLQISQLTGVIKRYRGRILSLEAGWRALEHETHRLADLIDEIEREIDELKIIPKVIRHKYREVSFEIHKSLEYASRKPGSDIDVEMTVGGTFKTLLPTRYEDNEAGWLDEIEIVFRNVMCKVMDDCFESEYFALAEEVDVRCNVVDRRITRRTIINVTKFYKDLEPPITIKLLRALLKRELERHTTLSVTMFQVMRSNRLGGEKSRNVGAETVITSCIKRGSGEILEELVDFNIAEEIEALQIFLALVD